VTFQPAGKPTTKPLNVGLTGGPGPNTIVGSVSVGAVTGANFYYSAIGLPGTYVKINPAPQAFNSQFRVLAVPPSPTYGPGPTSNTAGISPPSSTFASEVVSIGGTVPPGTYFVATTYVSALGETNLVPATVTVDSSNNSFVFNAVVPNNTAANYGFTTYATVEIDVPRLESWHVTRYAILASSNTSEPTCDMFVDTISLFNLLDATTLGSRNSANADLYLRPGQRLFARWTFLDVGANVTLSVFGEKTS